MVITTRDVVRHSKTYFDLAETEKIAIKRGNRFVNMIVTESPETEFISDNKLKDFFEIPEKYRCNPFDYCASGDVYFADKRNIELLDIAIGQAKKGETERKNRKFFFAI